MLHLFCPFETWPNILLSRWYSTLRVIIQLNKLYCPIPQEICPTKTCIKTNATRLEAHFARFKIIWKSHQDVSYFRMYIVSDLWELFKEYCVNKWNLSQDKCHSCLPSSEGHKALPNTINSPNKPISYIIYYKFLIWKSTVS